MMHVYQADFPDIQRTLTGFPVIGICGFSNSGKTTLIEHLIADLKITGFLTAIVKHYTHGFRIDIEGKDTDRFFQAGATVFGQDTHQTFVRYKGMSPPNLISGISFLARHHDLVIVEGHKQTQLPVKIWLRRSANDQPPSNAGVFAANLGLHEDRVLPSLAIVRDEIARKFFERPLYGGVFIDPEEFSGSLESGDQHAVHQSIVQVMSQLKKYVLDICLIGDSPVFSDFPDCKKLTFFPRGCPDFRTAIATTLQAYPGTSWMFINATHNRNREADIAAILKAIRPGIWSVLAKETAGEIKSDLMWIDSRAHQIIGDFQTLLPFSAHPKVLFADFNGN